MNIESLWHQTVTFITGLDDQPVLQAGVSLFLLLIAAFALGRLARFLTLHAVKLLSRRPSLHWLNDFLHNKVFHRLAQMTPSLVVQFSLGLIPVLSDNSKHVIGNIALGFTILFLVLALGALLNALIDIYARTEHARTRSIKGYVQLAKMVLYVFGAIIIVATLIDRCRCCCCRVWVRCRR